MSNTSFSITSDGNNDRITLDLTQWGIFISSLLLSFGGCMGMIIANLRKSNCSEIDCCGLSKCSRQNLQIDDV